MEEILFEQYEEITNSAKLTNIRSILYIHFVIHFLKLISSRSQDQQTTHNYQ